MKRFILKNKKGEIEYQVEGESLEVIFKDNPGGKKIWDDRKSEIEKLDITKELKDKKEKEEKGAKLIKEVNKLIYSDKGLEALKKLIK